MKKLIFIFTSLLVTSSMVLAVSPREIQGPGIGQINQVQGQTSNNPSSTLPLPFGQQVRQLVEQKLASTSTSSSVPFGFLVRELKAKTVSDLQQIIQQTQDELDKATGRLSSPEQRVYKKQNAVRLAVQSFLSMKDLIGGIGPEISQIAQGFNNSVVSTTQDEVKINSHNPFARFLFGGDKKDAQDLENAVNQNQLRVSRLNQLLNQCSTCSVQLKSILQQQVQNLENEQIRLNQLANNELKSKGIFDWFVSLFARNK